MYVKHEVFRVGVRPLARHAETRLTAIGRAPAPFRPPGTVNA